MKKTALLLLIVLMSTTIYAQKKKKGAKTSKKTTATSLGSSDGIVFEMRKKNDQNFIYLLSGKGKDSIAIKNSPNAANTTFTSSSIKPITANGTKLYHLSWIETSIVGEPKTKIVTTTKTCNEIWDATNKTQAMTNEQSVVNTKEIVFLDRLKTATETQEKNLRSGFEFLIQPDGSVKLKSKTQDNKYVYSTTDKKYNFSK